MATGQQLIDYIQQHGLEDRQVILAKDPEGNGYSPWEPKLTWHGFYAPITTWYGEVGKNPREARANRAEEHDVSTPVEAAIILVPIN